MNDNNFMRAMKFTAKWEGFFSNDKTDPGGKTKYGISDAGDGIVDGLIDIDRDGVGDVPVEELTREQALEIFYNFYWLASGCGDLDLPMAVCVFDSAVNCGVTRAKRWLRYSDDPKSLLDKRRQFYYSLIEERPPLRKYRNGWLNRLNDLHKYVSVLLEEMRPESRNIPKLQTN